MTMRTPVAFLVLFFLLAAGYVEVTKQRTIICIQEPVFAPPQPGLAVGDMPEIRGIAAWLNTPDGAPLTAADLEGKVVLIHFWTRGCYNCVNTLPHVNKWYDRFKDDPFVLIAVHTPEFDAEKDLESLNAALESHGIAYPVAVDNDMATWESFRNRYWPADYLFDRHGKRIYTHIGEGDYEAMERRIASALLGPE